MRKIFRELRQSEHGGVAVVFALSLVALIAVAGSAIDYARHTDWQAKIQASTDAAALAAASFDGTAADRKKSIKAFFEANFIHDDQVFDPNLDVTISDDDITVVATAKMRTSFMGIAGITEMPLRADSGASTGGTTVEIALVLDVSGSMRHALSSGKPRIDVLKTAAKQLVDIVTENGTKTKRVKIGVVPFNMTVNIGTANAGYVQGADNPLFAGQDWKGCVMERGGTGTNSDVYDGSTGAEGKWFAYAWPPEPNKSATACLNKSNGTNAGYAVLDAESGYAVNRRGPNFNCVRHPVMALTNSYTDINSKIEQLTAEWNQGTIIAPGVTWGMRMLSPGEPFTEAKPYSGKVKKYLIVLTDGEQTTEAEYGTQGMCDTQTNTGTAYHFDPGSQGLDGGTINGNGPKDTYSPYGYIMDSDPFKSKPKKWPDVSNDLYNVSLGACNAAKTASADGEIEIFSIAVSSAAGSGTTVSKLLEACATTPGNFFVATNDNALIGAFKDIAAKITQVRLTH